MSKKKKHSRCDNCGKFCVHEHGEIYCPECGWSALDDVNIGSRIDRGFEMLADCYEDICDE